MWRNYKKGIVCHFQSIKGNKSSLGTQICIYINRNNNVAYIKDFKGTRSATNTLP